MASEAQLDRIPNRIHFIKSLLDGKTLTPMVDLDSCDTEAAQSRSRDIRRCMAKDSLDFTKLIGDIGGKLAYIKSGTTGHTFKGVLPPLQLGGEPRHYAVKVVAYPLRENYGDHNDARRPENAELMMLKVLSYFVVNGHTPHLVLPIGTFNTSIKNFIDLGKRKIVESKKYDQFVKRYKQGEFHDEVSILISEWANGGDLLDYVRNNYTTMRINDWRSLFFQLLSVLAIIQEKYPDFRHNDLKANNVLVQRIGDAARRDNNYYMYVINGRGYVVPNIGIQVKVWDFDFACIPGIVDNTKVTADWTNRINVRARRNRYYDIHYFFNTLTKKGFFPQFWEAPEIPSKVKEFVRRVVPERLAGGKNVTDRGRILSDEEYATPLSLLETDPFFVRLHEGYQRYQDAKNSTSSQSAVNDKTTSCRE